MIIDIFLTIMQTLIEWDTQMTLWCNGWHTSYMDNFMELFTNRFVWLPFYASFGVLLFRKFTLKIAVACIMACVILLICNDQSCSHLIRPWVGRLRPSNPANPISAMIHIVDGYRGGKYGFPSAHSANCWGMAFFMIMALRHYPISFVTVGWALLMCYSRVYLGVHYIGDLAVGMLLGLLNAVIIYLVFRWLLKDTAAALCKKPRPQGLSFMELPVLVCSTETILLMILAFYTDL